MGARQGVLTFTSQTERLTLSRDGVTLREMTSRFWPEDAWPGATHAVVEIDRDVVGAVADALAAYTQGNAQPFQHLMTARSPMTSSSLVTDPTCRWLLPQFARSLVVVPGADDIGLDAWDQAWQPEAHAAGAVFTERGAVPHHAPDALGKPPQYVVEPEAELAAIDWSLPLGDRARHAIERSGAGADALETWRLWERGLARRRDRYRRELEAIARAGGLLLVARALDEIAEGAS